MLATNAETLRPGMIGTVAGTGEPGHDGDGGPALAACLNEPKNLALDSGGGLYIADSENHLVRKVDLNSGVISTVAGLAGGADESRRGEQAQRAPQASTQEEDPFADPDPSGP